jgi:hypothetical protein
VVTVLGWLFSVVRLVRGLFGLAVSFEIFEAGDSFFGLPVSFEIFETGDGFFGLACSFVFFETGELNVPLLLILSCFLFGEAPLTPEAASLAKSFGALDFWGVCKSFAESSSGEVEGMTETSSSDFSFVGVLGIASSFAGRAIRDACSGLKASPCN